MMYAKFLLTVTAVFAAPVLACGQDAIYVGSRRELFADEFLIAKLSGTAKQRLHQPTAAEVVLTTDRPWEGNTCAYYTIFQDGGIYRMYYRGSHYDTKTRKAAHREVTCYAESKDGVHWTRPNLGLFAFNGSKKNNIVWDGVGTHNFAPFKDNNPECPPESRYKALASGRTSKGRGLFAFHSRDGIRWQLTSQRPVITKGRFDSQNLAFWDAHAKLYREYHRDFVAGRRSIRTGTSKDFLKWTDPVYLKYPRTSKERLRDHLYTNAVQVYPRAPHLLIGFPTRFAPKEQQVEPTFMISRDGLHFRRWTEAVVPKTAPKDRAGNRSNYMTWGLVKLPGKPNEYSVYATEAYYTGPDSRVRRFVYRVDGFVSIHADKSGGALLTRPLRFKGRRLSVNYRCATGGSVKVALVDREGKAFDGFSANDCGKLNGDGIDSIVQWKGDLHKLVGQIVRLRFRLRSADLYSFQFRE